MTGARYEEGEPVARRRRIGRRTDSHSSELAGESLVALRADLILLREENARLKVAQHRAPDVGNLLARARTLPAAHVDRDSVGDETTRMLVEGLVIRESLLEICQEIERAMVAFEAKLRALQSAAPEPATAHERTNGHGPPGA